VYGYNNADDTARFVIWKRGDGDWDYDRWTRSADGTHVLWVCSTMLGHTYPTRTAAKEDIVTEYGEVTSYSVNEFPERPPPGPSGPRRFLLDKGDLAQLYLRGWE